jgi:toxin ParE1/3/4
VGQTRLVRLRYTLPALADLSSILDYIAAHSPQGARNVQARIQLIIDLLLTHPNIGTRMDDPTIRRMTASPYPYLVSMKRRRPRSSSMPSVMRHAIHPGCRAPPDKIHGT